MDRYGLVGFPLTHSFSKKHFNEKFVAEKINAEYVNFEIPTIKEFENIVKNNPTLKGMNVTIPYKQQVIPYLDTMDENARVIGAVNVIKVNKNKGKIQLIGHNTDIIGFKQSLEPLLKEHHRRALILGTGGASKAVFHGLQQLGIDAVFVSRKAKLNELNYDDLSEKTMREFSLIVNTSPVGMFPNSDQCPNIPYQLLDERYLLYDVVYNPEDTLFMKKGRDKGAIVKNGLDMLFLQALAAWKIWHKDT
ncbi:shikimate 5-dehydrogenase [Bacteroidales bacterium]|nr:shikimate 5-dehydrogenase [Bacteroidales bacterium]